MVGQHGARDAHDLEHIRIPVQGLQVHQHGAGGVGHIGDMHAALGAAGQVPDDPGVDVAEEHFALLSLGAHTGDIVQDPFDLGAGEIGRQRQTHFGAEAILAAVLGQLIADRIGAGVLPDDGIVNRLAGGACPTRRWSRADW